MESGHRKTLSSHAKTATSDTVDRPMPVAANACLLLITLLGVALLVWWVIVFHPGNEQLWMVPTSLVMVGTPVIVWISVSSTCSCRKLELLFSKPESISVVPTDPADLENL